jgi:bacillithiol biosynthesis deacetylase BshB1
MKLDILAFGAHPDDVELAAGGTLIKATRGGASAGMISLTRGEMGTRGTLEQRAAEFERAAMVMKLAVHKMLSLPDGGLRPDDASREAVVWEIREHRPTIVLLPYSEDRHPDHGAASRIVEDAAFFSGLRKYDTGQEPHRPAELLSYMQSREFAPSFVVDISDFMEDKKRALGSYETQVHNPSLAGAEEQTYISSEHYWELLMARAAHYGRLIGRKYGEPFSIKGLVEIKDVIAAFKDRKF